MKNKTVEEQAELYTSQQYVDYGDYSWKAEEQIEDAFLAGFSAKQKETDKIILDTLNKLRSNLADEEKVNQYKIELLKSQINVLLELQNKFANRDMQYTQKPKD